MKNLTSQNKDFHNYFHKNKSNKYNKELTKYGTFVLNATKNVVFISVFTK